MMDAGLCVTRANGQMSPADIWLLDLWPSDLPDAGYPPSCGDPYGFLQGELLCRLLFDIQQVVRGSAGAEQHQEVNQPQISPQNSIWASLIELFLL